jgi:hypothetical protein
MTCVAQVHTWNLHTPFGGIGIYVTGSSNRFTDNYLDCNAIYLEVCSHAHVIILATLRDCLVDVDRAPPTNPQ